MFSTVFFVKTVSILFKKTSICLAVLGLRWGCVGSSLWHGGSLVAARAPEFASFSHCRAQAQCLLQGIRILVP